LSICDEFIAFEKSIAKESDAAGYYAARILCDVLPIISQLDGLDGAAASKQLKETSLGPRKENGGEYLLLPS
jgi:hypothetical protein